MDANGNIILSTNDDPKKADLDEDAELRRLFHRYISLSMTEMKTARKPKEVTATPRKTKPESLD